MSKFVDCGRDQAILLPPDLQDWMPEDDLAHFVIEAVERVDMGAFKVNLRGTGSAQYHPVTPRAGRAARDRASRPRRAPAPS